MKWTAYIVALMMLVSAAAFAQDVAAAARRERAREKKYPPTKVWTNDDFSSGPLSSPDEASAEATPADTSTAKPVDTAKKEKAPNADDKEKAAALQKKINAEKTQIALLSRELDIAQREFKLQVANYYADAGNSLRDPQKWAQERDAKQKEIEDKKQALADAQSKLENLLEEARKSGLRVSQ